MHIPTFLDHKFRWLAIPNLIRAIASMQVVFFAILFFNKDAVNFISPDWNLIEKGELWRLVSFILYPVVSPPPLGGDLAFPLLFMFFATMIAFLENDVLEHALGAVRTTLYVLATILCQGLIIHVIAYLSKGTEFGALIAMQRGYQYHLAIFFAFATIAPNYEFRIMFILPVKVWVLAAISGTVIFISSLMNPISFLFYGISFFPYLCWAIPLMIRWNKTRKQIHQRRNKFVAAQSGGASTLHLCQACGKTELNDPDAEFRVAEDGEEYCLDHLP